jgi:hypothetical protein
MNQSEESDHLQNQERKNARTPKGSGIAKGHHAVFVPDGSLSMVCILFISCERFLPGNRCRDWKEPK